MSIDENILDEVEVIAEKTQVEIKLDKTVYNIGKDLTLRGSSVSDVLDNLPSVAVDINGNVSLRGNQSVRILINGKPSGLVGISSNDALKQFPSESVEKVEIITSPSARYDAEGTAGIINIVLRKNKLKGLNGSLSSNIGDPKSYGLSGNINFPIKTNGFQHLCGPRQKNQWFFNTFADRDRKTNGFLTLVRTETEKPIVFQRFCGPRQKNQWFFKTLADRDRKSNGFSTLLRTETEKPLFFP